MALKLICMVLLVALTESLPSDPPPIEPVIPSFRSADDEYRLPAGAVEVSHYNIELAVDKDTFRTTYKFEGRALVTFKNLLESNEIKIHADVVISLVTLSTLNGKDVPLTNTEFASDAATEILTLTTETPLPVNTDYILTFDYVGNLRTDSMDGFYRSTYANSEGNERVLGTTQFEPTYARDVFPCFDEPSYKAEFDIKIRHPTGYTAISNTQGSIEVNPDNPDFTTTTFVRTPKMPTYLIASVVSDFTCSQSEALIDGTIPHFICSREEAAPSRELALEYGPKLATALEGFTSVPYGTSTLTKLHQFAIPDFSAGAMENWGLITYRETAVLWDPQYSSNRYKQRVITVIAHELAHFWFGNLVTTHWWSDTFLNEGFATYFEYHIAHEVDPSLELDKQFVIEQLQPVLVSDAAPNSAPLSSPVSTPGQIKGRFSAISYNKGGCIFKMVKKFMGLDNFKNGIKKYLTDNQFGNSRPELLWAAFDNYAPENLPPDQTITSVMKNWVENSGYPLITVTAENGVVTLTQKRYLSSGEPGKDEQWFIPITYTVSSDSNKFEDTATKLWLIPDEDSTTITLENGSDWIILNNQQIGYYRVLYDYQLWKKINLALNEPEFNGIHELNRAQLVDDFFNLVKYGYKSFVDLLEFLTFLKKDTSYYSWYAASKVFSYMTVKISNEELRTSVSNYILELVEPLYNSLPFNEAKYEDQIYTHKKVLVLEWACRLGRKDCIDKAVAAFDHYKQTLKYLSQFLFYFQKKYFFSIPDKNLREAIFCNGLHYSEDVQNDFDFLWNQFLKTTLVSEKVTILSALGCAKNAEVLENYLRKFIDPSSGIRKQDTSSVLSSIYRNNPDAVNIALNFLVKNYKAIADFYGAMNSLSFWFSGLASRFTRKEQADKLLEFINTADLGDAERSARAAHTSALANLQFIEKFEKNLNLYFRLEPTADPNPGSASTISTGLVVMMSFIVLF